MKKSIKQKMNLSRHVDATDEFWSAQYPDFCDMLARSIDGIGQNPSVMNLLAGMARRVFVLASVFDANLERLHYLAKVAAQGSCAVFALAAANGEPCSIQLGERHYTLQTTIESGFIHFDAWNDAFYLSVIAGERDLTDFLCRFPFDRLEQSSTKVGKEEELEAKVLRAYWTGHGSIDIFVRDLLAYEPTGRLARENRVWRQLIGIPTYRLLACLCCNEGDFSEMLANALVSFKQFWTKTKERSGDLSGFLPVSLVALACLAAAKGITISVESDYIPLELVESHRQVAKE